MCPQSFGGVRFDLGSLLQGRMWYLIPMIGYISPIIGRRGFGCGKSCAQNLLVGSHLTLYSVCHASTMSCPGIHFIETQSLVFLVLEFILGAMRQFGGV